jgi:hypothetical protein
MLISLGSISRQALAVTYRELLWQSTCQGAHDLGVKEVFEITANLNGYAMGTY